jgi:hypothetical protein
MIYLALIHLRVELFIIKFYDINFDYCFANLIKFWENLDRSFDFI